MSTLDAAPNPAANDPREPVQELLLAEATGVWAIRSSSGTVYYVDASAGLVYRARGAGSGEGLGDNSWVPLVSVERLPDETPGVITVGRRHHYLMDPSGGVYNYQWWIQRLVERIERVPAGQVPGRD